MKILNVIESAYRGSLEEQDDTILWLSGALKNSGAELSVLLRSNAVNYVARQQCPVLRIGSASVNHPATPNEDLLRLKTKGVVVYVLHEDLEERGIDPEKCIGGIEVRTRREVAGLFDEHDLVWHW